MSLPPRHRWTRNPEGWSTCRLCGVERRLAKDCGRGVRVLEFRVAGGVWVGALLSPACPRYEVATVLVWGRVKMRRKR